MSAICKLTVKPQVPKKFNNGAKIEATVIVISSCFIALVYTDSLFSLTESGETTTLSKFLEKYRFLYLTTFRDTVCTLVQYLDIREHPQK